MNLSRQELSILLAWAEQATRGRFGAGDDPSGMTWEEQNLIKKIKTAIADAK